MRRPYNDNPHHSETKVNISSFGVPNCKKKKNQKKSKTS